MYQKEVMILLKNKLNIICAITMIILVITSCAPAKRMTPLPIPRVTTLNPVIPKPVLTPSATPYVNKLNKETFDKTTKDLTKRAQKISTEICKINTIKSATTIITGNTALIGIQLKPNSEGKANEVKSIIDKKVKNSDKLIKKVVVTIDPSLYKRIENIGNSISQGKPLSGFIKELTEIINRIMPK